MTSQTIRARRATLVLLLIVFVDIIGFGIVVPILPFIVTEYGGNELTGGAIFAIYSLMSVIVGPFWGRLSDRIGRKPALMLTLLGGVASYIFLGLADSLVLIFAARALSGMMAGNIGVVMAAIADLTNAEQRTRALGLIGVAFGMGFALGPGLAGVLADLYGQSLALPAFAAGTLSFLAVIMNWFLLPAITPPAEDANAIPSSKATLVSFANEPAKITLLLQFVLVAIIQSTVFAMTGFWAQSELGWSQKEVGYLMMGTGLLVAFVQGVAIGPLTRWLGDIGAYQLGLVASIVGGCLIALGPSTLVVAAFSFPLVMGGMTLAYPILNGLMSKRNSARVQGAALGVANSMAAIGRVIGPVAGGQFMGSFGPAAPFLTVVAVAGLAMTWALSERAAGRNVR